MLLGPLTYLYDKLVTIIKPLIILLLLLFIIINY